MTEHIRHAICVFFDHDRDNFPVSEEWVRERHRIFRRTTLRSLAYQTFRNFEVWLLCGQRHKDITATMDWGLLPGSDLPWCPVVTPIYDRMKTKIQALNSDYLAVSRLDSDDLFHADAVAEIARESASIASKRLEYLIFRKNLHWNRSSGYIGYHYRKAPPFWTHIYPRKLYKDYRYFHDTHFTHHGSAGGRLPQTRELSKHKVCVIKHDCNISRVREGLQPVLYTRNEVQEFLEDGTVLTAQGTHMRSILQSFGMPKREVWGAMEP